MSRRTILEYVAARSVAVLIAPLLLLLSPVAVHAQDHAQDDVANRTAVSPTGASLDDRLAMQVTMSLKEDPAWGTIRVERVDEGVVWLGGTVADERYLADALEAVKQLEGVREIRNAVLVTAPVAVEDAP